MNSAKVAGGAAPAPFHSIWLEPQSPVEQLPWPLMVGSNEQPVRPQNRPDHPGCAWKDLEVRGGSWKPVVPKPELPALDNIPGHTV